MGYLVSRSTLALAVLPQRRSVGHLAVVGSVQARPLRLLLTRERMLPQTQDRWPLELEPEQLHARDEWD